MPWWIVPVTLNFSVSSRWHGLLHQDVWYFDSGEYFDDGLAFDSDELTVLATATAPGGQTIVVDNDGNQAVRDAIIYLDNQRDRERSRRDGLDVGRHIGD